jgi:hypothetical protein
VATPLTEDQRARIRRYLGFSEILAQFDMPESPLRLNSVMDELANKPQAVTDQIVAILGKLQDLDAKLHTGALVRAGLKKAEEIEWYPTDEWLEAQRSHGRMLIQEISITCAIYPPRDYYGSGPTGGVISLG